MDAVFTTPFDPNAPSTTTSGGTTSTSSTTAGGSISSTTTVPTYNPTNPQQSATTITNIQGTNGVSVISTTSQNTVGSNVKIGGNFGIYVNTLDGNPYINIGNGIMQIGKDEHQSQIVSISSSVYAGSIFSISDERLKTDIELLENCLEKIDKLKGVSYTWRDGHGGKEIGVIAQDIKSQFPELVSTNKDNFLTVDYPKLTAVLLEGIKEMKKEIETIKESLKRKPRQSKKNKDEKEEDIPKKKETKPRVKKA
jgi:hypothetical protein